MARSKFKLPRNGIAQVIATGEPVFVKDYGTELATVTRAIVTQNDGIIYRDELFPVNQLETRYAQAKRNVELEEYVVGLRKQAEARMFALPKQMRLALEQAKTNHQA